MRNASHRQPTVNVSLVLLVMFGALLVTLMIARTIHVPGHEVPQLCSPSASYAVVSVAHGGATRDNADGAFCTRPGAPILPVPTPSNHLIDDRRGS